MGIALEASGTDVSGTQYVTFNLNDEEYAVEAMKVQEIVELTSVTRVPHLPDYMRGVINLRGTIIPVLDMKAKFRMTSQGNLRHTCVIVIESAGGVMGLIVDAVSDVMHLGDGAISAPPSFGPRIRTEFLKGMGKVGERLILVLDIDRVLSEEDAAMLVDAMAQGEGQAEQTETEEAH